MLIIGGFFNVQKRGAVEIAKAAYHRRSLQFTRGTGGRILTRISSQMAVVIPLYHARCHIKLNQLF